MRNEAAETLRIDLLLWRLRFMKSRGLAQRAIEESHIRLNGRRVIRASSAVRVGDILTMPWSNTVLAFKILFLPDRRGPTMEAQACYDIMN